MNSLFDRRITVLLGKGGVGKTTVAAALGLCAADRGYRVLVAETSGATQLPRLFGLRSQGYRSVMLRPGLHTMSITGPESLADYAHKLLKVERLVRLLFDNRTLAPLVDGVPGLHDVMQLGAVFEQSRTTHHGLERWDRIVVDGPATGHGRTLLDAPRSMMEVTRAGPLYEGARMVHGVLGDPRTTGLVLVTSAETLAVRETVELWESLGDAQPQVVACVLNQAIDAPPIGTTDWRQAQGALATQTDEALCEALALATTWVERFERQQHARQQLQRALSVPIIELPQRPSSTLERSDIEQLAAVLGGSA